MIKATFNDFLYFFKFLLNYLSYLYQFPFPKLYLLLIPVNIFGVCKRLKGNVWQWLKMMGTKTICNRMFLKCFMKTVY